MIEIRELSAANFRHFISLLEVRGEAPEEFYQWKYLQKINLSGPVGFLAYLDNHPVGCIGIVHRILTDAQGVDHPATWFADWFVLPQARGTGIGKQLMMRVAQLSDYNFGIPGPTAAQAVCKAAGYRPVKGLVDARIILRPFRYGKKRFDKPFPLNVIRGCHQSARYLFGGLPFIRPGRNILVSDEFPDAQALKKLEEGFNSGDERLRLKTDFLASFQWMPISDKTARSWWSAAAADFFAFGFEETDYWGLRKVTIVGHYCAGATTEFINALMVALKKKGTDWISFTYMKDTVKGVGLNSNGISLPLYFSGSKTPTGMYVQTIDRESSWRSLRFNAATLPKINQALLSCCLLFAEISVLILT